MPYIKKEDRPKFDVLVDKLLEIIPTDADDIVICEHTGYAISQILGKFIGIYDIVGNENMFNCNYFESKRKEEIITVAECLAAEITLSRNMIQQSGELNYVFSRLTWGILGDAPNRSSARYGVRVFLKGCLQEIIASLKPYYGYNRYYLMAKAVLTDVIDETYRRKTSVYEDEKIEQNGDVWD